MLLMIPLEGFFDKISPFIGFAVSFALFLFTKNVSLGYLGFGSRHLLNLPDGLYQNDLTAYLGFPGPDFFSTDYFPLIPWFFLFVSGYFLHRIFCEKDGMDHLEPILCRPLECLGRHTLGIYMIHQPVLYALFLLIFTFIM